MSCRMAAASARCEGGNRKRGWSVVCGRRLRGALGGRRGAIIRERFEVGQRLVAAGAWGESVHASVWQRVTPSTLAQECKVEVDKESLPAKDDPINPCAGSLLCPRSLALAPSRALLPPAPACSRARAEAARARGADAATHGGLAGGVKMFNADYQISVDNTLNGRMDVVLAQKMPDIKVLDPLPPAPCPAARARGGQAQAVRVPLDTRALTTRSGRLLLVPNVQTAPQHRSCSLDARPRERTSTPTCNRLIQVSPPRCLLAPTVCRGCTRGMKEGMREGGGERGKEARTDFLRARVRACMGCGGARGRLQSLLASS